MLLETPRLLLREFEDGDAPATNVYERDPEVVRFQSFATRSLAESLDYIVSTRAASHEQPRRIFDLAVVLRDEQRLVGRCGMKVTDAEAREGMLWYVLNPAYWGRGIIPEAARALLGFGFGELGLHRIIIDCDPDNQPSIRVAEKLGMRREAHFVENAWVKGRWADSLIFGLLDREWAAQSRRPAEP
ncbi:MAG TPA: GNAT family protein [Polyangiaceae bacterium]|nr:GNAT family protein [Polyangiaceae bacterium]